MQLKGKFLLPLLCASAMGSWAQTFEWGGRFGGIGEDVVRELWVDAAGNSYTTGYYTDSADFNIGAGTYMLTANAFYDVFVQKTDAAGDLVWAKGFGGTGFDYGTSVVSDAQGNVYVSGVFEETVDFDPGAGTTTLTSNGGQDIFVVKLDVNGNFVWAKNVGSDGYDESTGIGADGSGNVYVSGYFNGTADFDPGAGSDSLTSAGFNDNFVVKLTSVGDLVWAKRYGNDDLDIAMALKVNAAGDLFITGIFNGEVDFDPNAGVHLVSSPPFYAAGFVLKLNTDGDFQFVRHFMGSGTVNGYDVDIDANDNIYLGGTFAGSTNFDPGNGTDSLVSPQFENAYIVKMDATGNLVWARALTSLETLMCYSIDVSPSGNVMASGYFENTADFNPDPLEFFELTPGPNNAMGAYIAVLDANGNFLDAQEFGGANFVEYHGASTDDAGNIYISGAFETTVDINPQPGELWVDEVTALDFRDDYLIKLKPGYASIAPETKTVNLNLYPNPAVHTVTLQTDEAAVGNDYSVFDQTGRRVLAGQLVGTVTVLPVSTLSNGMYFLHVAGRPMVKWIKN